MKKIGIISLYHNSRNYGGLLQAYALTQVLSKMGFDAEQIDYDNSNKSFWTIIKDAVKKMVRHSEKSELQNDQLASIDISARNKCLDSFRMDEIKHSKAYNNLSIKETVKLYDIFICGSDQIWNYYFNNVYFLSFVPDNKMKISYAASMEGGIKKQKVHDWIIKQINRINYVSVREKELIDVLSATKNEVKYVLDPTLLLSEEEWGRKCAPIKTTERYILSYFLGNNVAQRKVTEQFAKKHGLKIYTIPFLNPTNTSADKNFGDKQLIEVGPYELLSYIKNAEYIFTDSFHVTLFSNLFKKEFFVFSREGKPNMSIRITSLLRIFSTEERFINGAVDDIIEHLCSLNEIAYDFSEYYQLRDESLKFLIQALSEG